MLGVQLRADGLIVRDAPRHIVDREALQEWKSADNAHDLINGGSFNGVKAEVDDLIGRLAESIDEFLSGRLVQ